jgi:hypothetical protein
VIACAGMGLAVAAGCGAYSRFYHGVVRGGVPYSGRRHRGLLLERLHGAPLEFYEERCQVGSGACAGPQQPATALLSEPNGAVRCWCVKTWLAFPCLLRGLQALERAQRAGQLLPQQHQLVARVTEIGGRLRDAIAAGLGGGDHNHVSQLEWHFHVASRGVDLHHAIASGGCGFAGAGNLVVLHLAAADLPDGQLAAVMALQFAAALGRHTAELVALKSTPLWWPWDLADTAYCAVASLLALRPLEAVRTLYSYLAGRHARLVAACEALDAMQEGPGDTIDHVDRMLDEPALQPLMEAIAEVRRVQVLEADRIAMMLVGAAGYDPRCLLQVASQEGCVQVALQIGLPIFKLGRWFSSRVLGWRGDVQEAAVVQRALPLIFPVSMAQRMQQVDAHLDSARRQMVNGLAGQRSG